MVRKASIASGAALQQAEEDKLRRYPPSGGRCVTTCAIETWGRPSAGLSAVLTDLELSARLRQNERGQTPGGRKAKAWLLEAQSPSEK